MGSEKIVVIGSSNTDMVVQSSRLPRPGETIMGNAFSMNAGGKGANQAVAAARLGGEVSFIGRVGDDLFGRNAVDGLKACGINVEGVVSDTDHPSGVAVIMVDDKGENCISVALGANVAMDSADIERSRSLLEEAGALLIQLEIPLEVVHHAIDMAHEVGIPVVLNPAPAQNLPTDLVSKLSIITPNETEAELLTGIRVIDQESAREAANVLREMGVETVIITMGSQGVYLQTHKIEKMVPCPQVEVVDTTAAGDTFNGALVVALVEGKELQAAVEFANRAAAFSVTRLGAQPSAPTRQDLDNLKTI